MISGKVDTASGVVASTVFGGAGADRMLGGSIESAGVGIDWTFGYQHLPTHLAAMDTIAIGGLILQAMSSSTRLVVLPLHPSVPAVLQAPTV